MAGRTTGKKTKKVAKSTAPKAVKAKRPLKKAAAPKKKSKTNTAKTTAKRSGAVKRSTVKTMAKKTLAKKEKKAVVTPGTRKKTASPKARKNTPAKKTLHTLATKKTAAKTKSTSSGSMTSAKTRSAGRNAVSKSKTRRTVPPLKVVKSAEKIKAAPKARKEKTVKAVKPFAVVKPVERPLKKIKEQRKTPVTGTVEPPQIIAKPIVKKKEKMQPNIPLNGNGKGSEIKEKTRYSDEELTEFRELILNKLEAARNELKYLQEQISRSSDLGSDDSDARFKGLEDGTSTSEKEYLSQMASRQIQYIGHLEKALIRIENKTYGICRETGKLISKERLRAVPHATLSIEAKQAKG